MEKKAIGFYKYGNKDGEYSISVTEEVLVRLKQAEVGGKMFLRVLAPEQVNKDYDNPAAGFINFRGADETAAAKAKYAQPAPAEKADEL